jgi:hypothetical protein
MQISDLESIETKFDLILTPEGKMELIHDLYSKATSNIEFVHYDEIGTNLFLLMGAILQSGKIDLTSDKVGNRMTEQFLTNNYDTNSPVWLFVE